MKKLLVMVLTLALLLSMAACTKTPAKQPDTPDTTPTQGEQQNEPEIPHYDWADDLPRMDGSTSTIPLEAGIRAALFGISQAEAELQVTHSTTYGSFDNLINGRTDLIFSVPLSDEQIKQAGEKGIELEMTAVAAEGFVFVVNAENPVDTLTQQQLRDIYSGKITNWSEVGGNDAPIVAYQRNETSGSQNFMHTFMGDTPLMDPLTSATYTPSGMGELMDAVAYYDNAENAIGYSVYAYAADMYGNGNEIKFIHVDGVEPTKTTMADGSYPLLGYNYAVYDKAAPANGNLRKLVEWLGTDEGQRAVKAAGYIPLRDVGEVTETVLSLYNATGTGPEKPANYTPSLDQYRVEDYVLAPNGTVDGLVNTELQAEINAFIAESESAPQVECINGYLAVATDKGSRIYDLVAGRRIAFSDLFFKGEEFVPTLNEVLSEETKRQRLEYDENGTLISLDVYDMKREFVGIPAGHDAFLLTRVAFPQDNLYFSGYTDVPFKGLYSGMVLSRSRDMSGLFEEDVSIHHDFATENGFGVEEPLLPQNMAVTLLDETHYDPAVAQKVNAAVREYCKTEMSEKALLRWQENLTDEEYVSFHGNLGLVTMGDRYFRIGGSMRVSMEAPYGVELLFDIKTGEEVPYTALLKEGWRSAARWTESKIEDTYYLGCYEGEEEISEPDLSDAICMNFCIDPNGFVLTFGIPGSDTPLVCAVVPESYVNWDI